MDDYKLLLVAQQGMLIQRGAQEEPMDTKVPVSSAVERKQALARCLEKLKSTIPALGPALMKNSSSVHTKAVEEAIDVIKPCLKHICNSSIPDYDQKGYWFEGGTVPHNPTRWSDLCILADGRFIHTGNATKENEPCSTETVTRMYTPTNLFEKFEEMVTKAVLEDESGSVSSR